MKNYLAKLRENEEKGFSLVELIIVMAIMAILVDDSFDLATKAATADITFELNKTNLTSKTSATIESTFAELCGQADTDAVVTKVKSKFTSKKAKASGNKLYVTLKADGSVTIDLGTAAGTPASAKLTVTTE